eukprot:gene19906-24384_t
MTAGPEARIKTIAKVDLPHPRDLTDPATAARGGRVMADDTLNIVLPKTSDTRGLRRMFNRKRLTDFAFTCASILGGLLVWQLLSLTIAPLFLPSPLMTLEGLIELWQDGTLVVSVVASSARIAAGWSLGVLVGIPL